MTHTASIEIVCFGMQISQHDFFQMKFRHQIEGMVGEGQVCGVGERVAKDSRPHQTVVPERLKEGLKH